ncbi:HTH-type transcriptional regulator CysB [Ectothiorhodospira lacustris]|uniref:HTH-type transcriptional regulator CysB n=1 Tax=Ectothiorhodospira lacustris TaxID=2899127 RepID=UPI001EE86EB1|nr:HTH-type transcriptional regulator CysB [Ectothiorhodospira lacustris]MCG5500225.1 HTH-type transcriptional regulator CysB [Ectothiorhodospira lacustris]MCG5509551.1 HTH-type transcriptional regulator CysB [Ectothiorhodospira lacustris]MCG5521654.1 HTH-type transcriptional regulator CysB [Ectothiorhodospira lacustris]
MKLQQLRYLKAIVENNLNVTEAAERLFTSQPGVSKQVKLLEEELGLEIFHRSGKHFTHVTPAGRQIMARAENILGEVQNIRALAEDFRDEERGTLRIATTHTQARYFLPPLITQFRRRYPRVHLLIHQGTPVQISQMAASGEVDFAIATEAIAVNRELLMIPAYRWHHCVVVDKGHPLTRVKPLALEDVAGYPIVTYVHGFSGRGRLEQDFANAGVAPEIVLSAADSDVIKTYVRLGLGIGIIAHMAYEPGQDTDLAYLDAKALFTGNVTRVGFRKGVYLRRFMCHFMELIAPHAGEDTIHEALNARTQESVDRIFEGMTLPEH